MSATNDYLVEVFISLKPVVNDPQGLSIRSGLHSLGYNEVEAARAGTYLRLTVSTGSPEKAAERVGQMCEQLLANPVTETYEIKVSEAQSA